MTQKTNVLSMLVHASAKVGKSTLSSTAPHPVVVLDAEGSWRFIKVRKKYWDPLVEAPPIWDGTWDACIVQVTTWQTIEMAYAHLVQSPHNFRSAVLDSITEVQRRLKQNLKGTEAMFQQDWGVLLAKMDGLIRSFRDLTLLPNNTIECVVFVAETREFNGKWAPYMQGAMRDTLPYIVDICGYLYPDFQPDENGQATQKVRRLFIGDHPQFVTGERVQGVLGDVVTNANIDEMIKTIFEKVTIMEVTQ